MMTMRGGAFVVLLLAVAAAGLIAGLIVSSFVERRSVNPVLWPCLLADVAIAAVYVAAVEWTPV